MIFKCGDKYQFVMYNLPKVAGRYQRYVYHIVAIDNDDLIFSSLEPGAVQYQAEHFHLTTKDLYEGIKDGNIQLFSRVR